MLDGIAFCAMVLAGALHVGDMAKARYPRPVSRKEDMMVMTLIVAAAVSAATNLLTGKP
jgi:hypothetical protein